MKKTIPYKINIFLGILILAYNTQSIGAAEGSAELPSAKAEIRTISHKKWYHKAKDAIVSSGTKIKHYWNAEKMSDDILRLKLFNREVSNFETEETRKENVTSNQIGTLKSIVSDYPFIKPTDLPTKSEIDGIIENLEKARKNKILKNRGITIGTSIGGVGLLGLGAVAMTKGIKKGFKNIFK